MKSKKFILPAEWEPQSAIQLTWPHAQTDWNYMLGDITATYVEMAREIADHERLLIVAPRTDEVKGLLDSALPASSAANIVYHECPTNDTWARDHGFITLKNLDGEGDERLLLDFCFNGWGRKFESDKDNAINRSLYDSGTVRGIYRSELDFVLEGGSIESDGRGTVFTTSQCLLAPHRNQPLTQQQIEQRLKDALCASRIVWLDHGNLIGDDTDGHIDTIVRLAPDDTLLYIGNVSPDDEQHDGAAHARRHLRRRRQPAACHLRQLPRHQRESAGAHLRTRGERPAGHQHHRKGFPRQENGGHRQPQHHQAARQHTLLHDATATVRQRQTERPRGASSHEGKRTTGKHFFEKKREYSKVFRIFVGES